MSVVVLEDVELGFGGRKILDSFSLRIGEGDRIGLIGRNGSGKSTLLRVLAGEQEPGHGSVRPARGIRIGYLPQELEVEGGRGLRDYVLAGVPGRAELEARLAQVEQSLERADSEELQLELSQELVDLHENLAHFDAEFSPHQADSILEGLGFRTSDIKRDITEFSGGWRMRGVLASLLFQRPHLLMMDEPTNHLDVLTVEWLGGFLKRFPAAMILVCHDREFLNEQINRVISYEPEGIRQYSGNYEDYRRQRAEEKEILERRAVNLSREREAAERFIRRFRAQATKAKAVQSRVRALEKLDDVTLLQEQRSLAFRFPPCERAGQETILLENLGHSYGDHKVLKGLNHRVRRGDRLAILGANGVGKTTLLKILAGEMEPTEGSFRLGHNVKPGYYAQHVTERLDVRSSIFDEVWRGSELEDLTQVRSVLGTFMFSDDDVDKIISILSGGEKARVALASLMVKPGNLLLMDEPTNHLDLESAEALAEALDTYDGTLVFVSHNRSFINRLATRIWNVTPEGVEEYPGTFDEFLHHLGVVRKGGPEAEGAGGGTGAAVGKGTAAEGPTGPTGESRNTKGAKGAAGGKAAKSGGSGAAGKAAFEQGSATAKKQGPGTAAKPVETKEEARRRRAAEREATRATRALERKVADFEKRIEALEEEQRVRELELAKPDVFEDRPRYDRLLAEYSDGSRKLEELMARWEQSQEEFAAAQSDKGG